MQDPNRADEKFEALGRVAGSLAHDFNNLLHVITMNLELVSMYARDEKVAPVLDRAKTAARKGARLTAQLLSFARTDAVGARAVDLNAHLQGISELLQVCAGSAVEVEVVPASGPARALVDPVQLSLALVALAGDARDALPGGGRLRLAAETAGNGVALRCTDTRSAAGDLPREAAALVASAGGSAQAIHESDGACTWLLALPAAAADADAAHPAALSTH
jgi:signal transduction histidine kinase